MFLYYGPTEAPVENPGEEFMKRSSFRRVKSIGNKVTGNLPLR